MSWATTTTRAFTRHTVTPSMISGLASPTRSSTSGPDPLNESVVAASGGPSYLTNEHLRVYNGLMQKAAEEKQVVFLDLYSEFANENGELPEEASKDGVHLKSDYCKQWLEYLKVHTVDFETLYPEGTET